MGGFSSVMTGLSLVSNLVGGASSYKDDRKQSEASVRAMQARQEAEYQKTVQDAALSRSSIAAESQKEETKRLTALKRAVARQRAQFGSAGITPSSSGSAEAVLLGLFEESEEEKAARDRLDALRYQALDSDVAYKNRINVLELSEAREKQKIGQATSLYKTIGTSASLLS